MARKYQEAEKMQTCAVRMGASMLARIDAYGARLKAQHPGLRVERADAVRDLMLKALALVEDNGQGGSGDAGGGPVEAPVTLEADQAPTGKDRGADSLPMNADQFTQKTAQSQDRKRTTGRKRTPAAKG